MRINIKRAALGLLCVLASACQPLQATPLPTLTAVRVQYSPAAKSALQPLSDCAAQLPGAGIVVSERAAGEMDLSQADLSLRYGLPADPPAFSAQVGEDQLVAVVNVANQVTISPGDLAEIYTGQLRDWNDLEPAPTTAPTATRMPNPIQVWTYSPGDDLRDAFTAGSLAGAPISVRVNLAPSPTALLEALTADPTSIGYLPRSLITPQLRVLDFPDTPPIQIPLLVLSPTEPQGPARSLLACLQHK
jgi:ABC-type phosphate transport system substrate-binding protein